MPEKKRGSGGKVRVALIGAGAMANSVHYPSLKDFSDVELVGLCDLVPEKLQTTADKFGVSKTYNDFRKMLDETKPQAVYALMPPHHVYDVAIEVIERGLDVFVEKPPALTTHQAECLAHAAATNNVINAVGFQRRYHPLFLRCYQEVRKHGPLHQVVATFYKNVTPGKTHPYYRGAIDILTSDAIHAVDALRFFCGGDVQAVAADVRRLDCWYHTSFNAIVAFDRGATGILLTNWRTGGRRLTMELHAPGCSAFINADGAGEIFADNKAEPILKLSYIEAAGSDAPYIHQGFRDQTRAFIDAVKNRRPPQNTLADAVKTMRLVDAIYARSMSKE